MRPIDADVLIEKMVERKRPEDGADWSKERYRYIQWLADYWAVKDAPTIDAVSVVRCKDCKHWHDHITTTWCSRGAELRPQESGWIKRNADDFCSYGERKDDETD